jgi:hypothetical protein
MVYIVVYTNLRHWGRLLDCRVLGAELAEFG